MKRHLSILSLLAFATTASLQADLNLIVNPGFESGNTNFTSDYAFWPTNTVGDMGEGRYSVVTNATQVHQAWNSLSAQSGTNYLVANGSTDTNLAPWIQTISINPGDITVTTDTNTPVYYRFEAYIASVYPDNPPRLSFEMSLNNSGEWQTLTTSPSSPTTAAWYLTYRDGYFNFAPSTISFRLRNAESALGGNDFGIDSIYFDLSTNSPSYLSDPTANPINSIGPINGGVVPEPGTWAAAVLLAGCAGWVGWRRRPRSSNPTASSRP